MSNGGFIPKEKFKRIIVEDEATNEALVDVYNQIIKLIRKGKRKNDDNNLLQDESHLRSGINRRTSEKGLFS